MLRHLDFVAKMNAGVDNQPCSEGFLPFLFQLALLDMYLKLHIF